MNQQVDTLETSLDEEEQLEDQHLDQLQRIHNNMMDDDQMDSFIEQNKIHASTQQAYKQVMKHNEVNHARDIIQEKIKMRIEYLIKKKSIKEKISNSNKKLEKSRSRGGSMIDTSVFQ